MRRVERVVGRALVLVLAFARAWVLCVLRCVRCLVLFGVFDCVCFRLFVVWC